MKNCHRGCHNGLQDRGSSGKQVVGQELSWFKGKEGGMERSAVVRAI